MYLEQLLLFGRKQADTNTRPFSEEMVHIWQHKPFAGLYQQCELVSNFLPIAFSGITARLNLMFDIWSIVSKFSFNLDVNHLELCDPNLIFVLLHGKGLI